MASYDVVVLGAGPGGYVAAIRAAQLGLKTAIIEKDALGGVCLNIGCIPSKALLKNAEVAHLLHNRGREFGFSFEHLELDYTKAFGRSRQISNRLVKGVGFLMKKNGVEVFEGTGALTGRESIHVNLKDGSETDLSAANIIIATGASPRMLPGIEVDGSQIITYKEAIMAEELPQRAMIIGGGPIGLEFGYIWANYGVEVHIVEMMPHLLPAEEPEISEVVEKAYQKLGVNFHLDTVVKTLRKSEGALQVTLENGTELEVDQTMVAVSFVPNILGIGLELAGVEVERGAIKIDDLTRTSVPNIFAIGDVTAKLMLAHVGSAMGILAAECIAGHPTTPLEYKMMPRATYCVPQVASFGYTEAQAIEAGYEINVGQFPFQPNGKALGLGERDGFVKIISDAKYGEILGAHMVGPDVTELLPELTLARNAELTAEEIARNVHAHPTLSEVLMEAAHAVEGQPIHM